jgi:hypothetical protein
MRGSRPRLPCSPPHPGPLPHRSSKSRIEGGEGTHFAQLQDLRFALVFQPAARARLGLIWRLNVTEFADFQIILAETLTSFAPPNASAV